MMQKTKIKGAVAVFLSALVLYLATVVVRNGIALGLANVSQYVFARFLLGSLAIGALCLMKKKEI